MDPIVKIAPFSKLWYKIRRTMRKRHYIPGQGKGAPVPTEQLVFFKGGPEDSRIMIRFSDGSLRKSTKFNLS